MSHSTIIRLQKFPRIVPCVELIFKHKKKIKTVDPKDKKSVNKAIKKVKEEYKKKINRNRGYGMRHSKLRRAAIKAFNDADKFTIPMHCRGRKFSKEEIKEWEEAHKE